MKVSIHQPNFIPWVGFFRKVAKSDVFICYDSCLSDSKLNYEKRVMVRNDKLSEVMIGLPVVRIHKEECGDYPQLRMVKISEEKKNKVKNVRKIKSYYKNAAHYSDNISWIEECLINDKEYLADYNIEVIQEIMSRLNIKTKFIRSSELGINERANKANIEMTKIVGGKIYLSGNGAAGYQDDAEYKENNLSVQYVTFSKNEKYREIAEIKKYSILDAIFNFGCDHTGNYLFEG